MGIKKPFNVKADLAGDVGCRNRALVLFLLDTGVRESECIELEFTPGRTRTCNQRIRSRVMEPK